VLIFGLILKRFLNFRQASGNSSRKKFVEGAFFFLYRSFYELLFRRLFIFLANNFFIKHKTKTKNFY
jgi:hypothetical protein